MSIESPSNVHRFDGHSMYKQWTSDGGDTELERRIDGGTAEMQRRKDETSTDHHRTNNGDETKKIMIIKLATNIQKKLYHGKD